MGNISKELAKQAKKKGICHGWYDDLRQTMDVDDLLSMYLKGIDFCLSNDFPSNDYIRDNFKGKMEKHGIHLDEQLCIENNPKVVALGTCSGVVETNGYGISEVFVKHDSNIIINAFDKAFVMVDIFDNANLMVVTEGDAKVCINRYGGTVTFESRGNSRVKLIEKKTKTY